MLNGEMKQEMFTLQGIFHSFNVFRIREKQIPVDILEIKGTVNFCRAI